MASDPNPPAVALTADGRIRIETQRDAGPMSAMEGARRIRAWSDTMRALSRVAEAQVMEAAWAIRNEYPTRDAFDTFIREHVKVLPTDRAWLLAQTWATARRTPRLLRLTSTRPSDAVEFVRAFLDAGAEDRLNDLQGGGDSTIELLDLPARRRRVELLRILKPDHPYASAELRVRRARGSGSNASAVDEFQELELQLDSVSQRLAASPVSPGDLELLQSLYESAMMSLERIAEALSERP